MACKRTFKPLAASKNLFEAFSGYLSYKKCLQPNKYMREQLLNK